MTQQEYQEKMNSLPYTGLQLVHMSYKEAYDFAGKYGMNAIITTIKPPYEMMLVRLRQSENGRLRLSNYPGDESIRLIELDPESDIPSKGFIYNRIELDPEKYDIYWIGKK